MTDSIPSVHESRTAVAELMVNLNGIIAAVAGTSTPPPAGGSAAAAIDLIKAAGAKTIRMICIVSAPEGVKLLESRHPDVVIYTPVIDRELNSHKYIVPGLGDFGDRLYGTV